MSLGTAGRRVGGWLAQCAVGLALAACGGGEDGGDDGGGAGSSAPRDPADAAVAWAQCMRENGVDVPDPEPGASGGKQPTQLEGSPDQIQRAQAACQEHLSAVKPQSVSPEEQAQYRDAALRFARCMRERSIDYPDPAPGEELAGGYPPGVDPNAPGFPEAESECLRHLDFGGDEAP